MKWIKSDYLKFAHLNCKGFVNTNHLEPLSSAVTTRKYFLKLRWTNSRHRVYFSILLIKMFKVSHSWMAYRRWKTLSMTVPFFVASVQLQILISSVLVALQAISEEQSTLFFKEIVYIEHISSQISLDRFSHFSHSNSPLIFTSRDHF